ncbi:MAG: hypothetical protein MIO93_03115 [ANME-2 cluster archaeon]|nr:hypothetical protein [ANME-2 cluster archaeon]
MFKKILIFIMLCFIFTQTASAIGIGVTPGSLNFSVQAGGADTKSLFVINTGTEVSNYKVYVDDDYADWFDISPDNFNLNASEHKEVKLKLKPPISAKGEFDFKVYAVSSSPSSDFSVGSGIKVPVHTYVSNTGLMVSILLLLLVIGAGGFYYFTRRKKSGKNT